MRVLRPFKSSNVVFMIENLKLRACFFSTAQNPSRVLFLYSGEHAIFAINFTGTRMYYVKKKLEIAGCHRLTLDYESPCTNRHGHNWLVTIYCRSKELNANGMVCDFSKIKKDIHGYLDHGDFNELLPFNPTAENIAHWICERIPECYKVVVQESESNIAAYAIDDADF